MAACAAASASHPLMGLPMRTLVAASLLWACSSLAANAAEELDQSEVQAIQAMASFFTDVTTFEGMFHSVLDYCGPQVESAIAQTAKQQWLDVNQALLDDRSAAVKAYLTRRAAPGKEAEAEALTKQALNEIFNKARTNDRLYKDLAAHPDQATVCSRRLGAMSSPSMSFEKMAPNSFQFWRTQFAH